MKRLLEIAQLIRPYWKYVVQSFLVSVLMLGLSLPGPFITKVLIDDVYPHSDVSLMSIVLLVSASISLGAGLTGAVSGHFGQCVSIAMGYDLKSRFYKHIQGLDFAFFDSSKTGEVLSRFRDMEASVGQLIGMVNTASMNLLQLVVFPPILLYINWQLALVSLAVLPFDTALVGVSRRFLRRYSREGAEAGAELSAGTYESLSGIRTVQALAIEEPTFRRLQGLFDRLAQIQVKSSRFQSVSGLIATVFKTFGTLAYGWFGWSEVMAGNLTLGSFMAFSAYVGYLYGPIERLIGLVGQVEVAMTHTERFLSVYKLRPTIIEDPRRPNLVVSGGVIRFDNVSFAYPEHETVLHDINLEIEGGTMVALVGPSGSGKSTLAKLIPRFYDPVQGAVLIDGVDIRGVRLSSLRRQVGFALQGSTLFHGTILDNLTANRDVPMHEVESATRAAYIHDYIANLPDGYLTVLGEGGVQMSDGQRQRVALARTLLLDTPILILDEPTSALDEASEMQVRDALETVRERRTTIVITHSPVTMVMADRVVSVEGGRIGAADNR
jgi:ATP-binding cassette, subfamily B, bacterial